MKGLYTLIVLLLVGISALSARPFRVGQIPNGPINTCSNCHVDPNGGGIRNSFGKTVEAKFLDNSGNVLWGPQLASLDSDGDGLTNGQELQDPLGVWLPEQQPPLIVGKVSRPGVASDRNTIQLKLQFTGMGPHVGQTLYIRAVDILTLKETFRTSMIVALSDFDVMLDELQDKGSYIIDLFADLNANGRYDAPPIDHAWRIIAQNIEPNLTLTFEHNTNFTDIKWTNALRLAFRGMTPHIGQLLEVRAVGSDDNREVYRTRIESIALSDFEVNITGLQPGKAYNIDFYADLNKSGLYDVPPADHAWRIAYNNGQTDSTITFTHNTQFTDIGWRYLYTLNFLGMDPHIGQMLELRMVKTGDNSEIYRTRVDKLLQANFSLSVPGLEPNTNYNLDFYADLNGNSQYDAPPADHAWRISFNSGVSGNMISEFTHNTSFTDIQWPATAVDEKNEILPESFTLYQNYPNPFNPSTMIRYYLAEESSVEIGIYDILGKEVLRMELGTQAQGMHEAAFSAEGRPSGIYFYRVSVSDRSSAFTQSRSMMLVK